jgi:hypothetical protein
MLNGFGGVTPVMPDRWMSASMTEVKRLLQVKSGKALEAVFLTTFRSISLLAAIIPRPGSHTFRGK